jgi:hypothetical protein
MFDGVRGGWCSRLRNLLLRLLVGGGADLVLVSDRIRRGPRIWRMVVWVKRAVTQVVQVSSSE